MPIVAQKLETFKQNWQQLPKVTNSCAMLPTAVAQSYQQLYKVTNSSTKLPKVAQRNQKLPTVTNSWSKCVRTKCLRQYVSGRIVTQFVRTQRLRTKSHPTVFLRGGVRQDKYPSFLGTPKMCCHCHCHFRTKSWTISIAVVLGTMSWQRRRMIEAIAAAAAAAMRMKTAQSCRTICNFMTNNWFDVKD